MSNGWLLLPLFSNHPVDGYSFKAASPNYILASEIIAVQDCVNPKDHKRPCARLALRNAAVSYADMSADALLALVIRETTAQTLPPRKSRNKRS